MAGFGFGFGSVSQGRRLFTFNPGALPDRIAPGAGWTGTAGSGFSSTPADPARSTAKPVLRLIVPPHQFFTDTLLVGAVAGANDNGSLYANMGLSHVTVHYEGSSFDIAAPSYRSFRDANGNTVSYFGWWIELQHDGRLGKANVYFEAVPSDATMQHRVIGPYSFFPAAQVHDLDLEVAPSQPVVTGSRYKSITAAQTYAKTQNAQNPRITVVEAGQYDIADDNSNGWFIDGYCTIEASVPITIGKTAYTTDAAAVMQSNRYPLCIRGANVTLDFRYMLLLNNGANASIKNHWLDGCTLTNSAIKGRDAMWRGGPPGFDGYLVARNPWFTECAFSEVHVPGINASLLRGCTMHRVAQDIVSDCLCAVGNTVSDHSNETWNTDIPAISVSYSGAEATATLARSGGTEGNGGGVFTAVWGPTSATFDVGNGSYNHYAGTAGDGYWFADVVAWLNGLPGWNATLLIDPDRRACSASLAGLKGQGFAATDVKAAPLTVVSMHDKHGDFYQHVGGVVRENVYVADNIGIDMQVQCIFLAGFTSGSHVRDAIFANNVFYAKPDLGDYWDPANAFSQLGRNNLTHSHVVLAHNTLANQGMLLRTDVAGYQMDRFCLLANNVFTQLTWGGAVDADAVLAGNHLLAGATSPAGSTATTIGGSESDAFVDAGAGDLRPAGALLSNEKVPVLRYDRARSARPLAGAAAGALRG